MKKFIIISLWFIVILATAGIVRADECDNISSLGLDQIGPCISKFSGFADAISKANTTNQNELNSLNAQISKLKAQINQLNLQIQKLTKDVFDREVKIGVRETLLAARVKRDYIRKKDQPVLLLLFSSDNATNFFRDLGYRERLAKEDQEQIAFVSGEIQVLRAKGQVLSDQKLNLDALKKRVDDQATFLAGEVAKANKYVSDLSGKIASLTARQNELLAAKTGTYQTSVGDVPLADDPAARPDYNPGFSPAFALFSFGAPHFKGMSQYGAFGRAKNGQSYETILKAYYGNVRVQDVNTSLSLRTTAGTMDFENRYVVGIAEMPGSWGDEGGMEALKAQAIAARSYALAYTGWRMGNQNAGGTICVTEACQVWKASKADNPGKWREAVEQTKGKILVSNNSNEVVNAFYASTSGGYQESYTSLGHTTPGFWDTTSDWTRWADGAWEKTGGSPWFYKGWYKSRSGTACGRSHPWLHEDEFADIVNAALVYSNGGDASGIFPTDGCLGQTGWDKNRMAAEADKYGGRVSSISSVRVDHGSNGITNKVILATNRGNVEIAGMNFYKVFNLRAPGSIHLKSGLFNVEKK
ncbi:MAG: SpoIID/LytB domain protein [Candidatus Gottesmanbacteria bacterium GW2011_GWA1_48_13]|uniref:SpoIID/LytB domain protein n=1 Tax=Candidatus Gottesmanbacteria bacterium GW2011_GWA1_48_13 TaxID=1618439 RepID=A0A0G1XLU3_9BACT|nr:MAG: SpoIID/LytB domain protein [Candidatus Gottesmanbacteria bacterium GW2011_GWA1_48_13]